jgi:hypothetical protein
MPPLITVVCHSFEEMRLKARDVAAEVDRRGGCRKANADRVTLIAIATVPSSAGQRIDHERFSDREAKALRSTIDGDYFT